MFTGIVTDVGRVATIRQGTNEADTGFRIETAFDIAAVDLGASIACSGPCLTVVDKGTSDDGGWFDIEASQETLDCTTLGDWQEGTRVNLERALAAGQELGGHIVTGHVDAVIDVLSRAEEGGSIRFAFSLPTDLAGYVASKGSVALDGVSLTVNGVDPDRFDVNIISHTQDETTLGGLTPGDKVNLEVDLIARYVLRMLETRS
jgi:riboflavin synthase